MNHRLGRAGILWLMAILASSGFVIAPAWADGTLEAFEADVTDDPADEARTSDEEDDDVNAWVAAFWGEVFREWVELTFVYGGLGSWYRIVAPPEPRFEIAPRRRGEPLIPLARVDLSYQAVEADVQAIHLQTELGYGPLGVHVDATRYREREPDDTLTLIRSLALYRMSLGGRVELDLGLGALTLPGDTTTTRALGSLPLRIHPSQHWGLELRPSWAERVNDYDLALMLNRDFASLKLGYRWTHSPSESLDGPYVGLSFRL